MQEDGPRLAKLKEIYKKAVQEIMKEEERISELLTESYEKDSFYGDTSIQFGKDESRVLFSKLKERFGEVFKEKIRQNCLDLKLNNLDKFIRECRVRWKDLRDEEYIDEIFESHVVDMKESHVKALEEMSEVCAAECSKLEDEIAILAEEAKALERENMASEEKYQDVLSSMEALCNEK